MACELAQNTLKIGEIIGRLTILSLQASKTGKYTCKCECGKIVEISKKSMKAGQSRSCGCLRRDNVVAAKTTHNMSRTKIYYVYRAMLDRCYNSNHRRYAYCGARGIVVCERWRESFENFYVDMGQPPEFYSLGRIDTDGNYEPSNCRWFTRSEQIRNAKTLKINGVTKSLADWAALKNINIYTLRNRLARGWSVERALTRNGNILDYRDS